MLALDPGGLELGRDSLSSLVQDGRISRRHASVQVREGRFWACDHGSRNGTAVDGRPIPASVWEPVERCLRIGESLFLPMSDVRPLQRVQPTLKDGRVIGPRLMRCYQEIARIAQVSRTLLICGESGTGKEDAARAFHRASPAAHGPFVAVNCATIPESIAERLLFGAKRGAYSSADADVGGYVQAAEGGTLFLDEVAELQAAVQAKLLRLLENREVLPVGAARPLPVDLRVCSASHAALREQVAAGRLREDLYFRLGRPEITLPPLRERAEEIPWLVELLLRRQGAQESQESTLRPHHAFIEVCLLRHWPGNVRELLVEVGSAVQAAQAEQSLRIEVRHLSPGAGQPIRVPGSHPPVPTSPVGSDPTLPPVSPSESASPPSAPTPPPPASPAAPDRAALEDVLRRTGGNVSRAAQALGLNRTTLRRLLLRHQIDPDRVTGIIARGGGRGRRQDS
ncbi:MAG TPA: sigma 54-interacting transcriptional regulator [Pseudomonadota bacterium]|nr:sigma 54-interacting transcriptional regulator [Pseudomonadota bacterium]